MPRKEKVVGIEREESNKKEEKKVLFLPILLSMLLTVHFA